VYINPHEIEDKGLAAQQLGKALRMSKRSMRAKLKSSKRFLWVKRQVTPQESLRVRGLGLKGVHFTKEHKRYYPNGRLAGQLLGFTGLDPRGLEGLELRYDGAILGEGGYLFTERDASGKGLGGAVGEVAGAARGGTVELTLDKSIQFLAERELAAAVKKFKAKAGSVVVLDPETGRILAMASQPDFDPNRFSKYSQANFRNRAMTDAYEPGSTLKPFIFAGALAAGAIHTGEKIDCERGSYRVGGKVIHDHHPHGVLPVEEIIKVSSNIGAAKIGKRLEREKLYQVLRGFGFGQKTGINLPGEVKGVLRSPDRWFEIDLAAISFGQGVTITPLQLAVAVSVLANDGVLMRPYLVERVLDGNDEVLEQRRPKVLRRVVSTEVARYTREVMAMVTETGGTGTLGRVAGYRVAGKTGTAEKVDPVTGGYSVDKRVGSFVGMVPAEDPRLVILVVIDEPQTKTYGGLVAAPAFARIARQTLAQLHIPPTEAIAAVDRRPIKPQPEAVALLASLSQQKPLRRETGEMQMPTFLGMSYRQVLQTMERSGLNLSLRGSGRVIDQMPAPGAAVRYGKEIWVRLVPPSGMTL